MTLAIKPYPDIVVKYFQTPNEINIFKLYQLDDLDTQT